MTLAPGTRLGSYEIVAPIGAGGMGEVYKARDTKLGKPRKLFDVALIVPPNGVGYGASPDGSEFAVLLADEAAPSPKRTHVTMVFNFFDEVRRTIGGDRK